ncbi:methyl-accepting chemotaxis protein [Halobacillus sp. A5]|uniref:methyl-accepting chemotaxis protein n=1 Tax=Halobacillus sp. A5 TaxID=2880263 RepID=UPI00273A70EE|nr:methyl-accepting chemotaxis protein [Halobacillus sp. A5]
MIEAARDGDTGRGFEAAADEIRKLSNETAASTEKISTTLTNIQISMDETSASIEEVAAVGKQQAESTEGTSDLIDNTEKKRKELNKDAASYF